MTITKRDLINKIATQTGEKKVVIREAILSLLNIIKEELKAGNRIELRGFGVFKVKKSRGRIAFDFYRKLNISVPARDCVRFKSSKFFFNS